MGKIRRIKVETEEGKIFTPLNVALHMVDKLFSLTPPRPTSKVLDAGCGWGVFIEAMIMWCKKRGIKLPEVVGIEIDEQLARRAREKFRKIKNVKIIIGDFLSISKEELGEFDYIISNPPYISYEKIRPEKRDLYKKLFKTAYGRFDTYFLFFEKSLELLKPNGRLVFVTPEKYLYVLSARELRKLLAQYWVEEIELLPEDTFSGVLAYPAITVVVKTSPRKTRIIYRDGTIDFVNLLKDGSPWLRPSSWHVKPGYYVKLGTLALKLSAGIATGRDEIFVIPKSKLREELKPFAYPTVSGAELARFEPGEEIDYDKLEHIMLIPYSRDGRLLSEEEARPLIKYLSRWKCELESRYIVKKGRRPWYAFHEKPPLSKVLKPKILWPDIAKEPAFYVDSKGLIVPRHNTYYLVPKDPNIISDLIEWLNSKYVSEWLKAHCQRAANGYLRLQSHVLKELPVPKEIIKPKWIEKLMGGE